MGLDNPQEARKYLEHHFKKPMSEIEKDLTKDGKVSPDKRRSRTVNHMETANLFLKVITLAPISQLSKRIMRYKIWNPGVSKTNVSLNFGLREHEVQMYEQEGILGCKRFLERCDAQTATDKFNKTMSIADVTANKKPIK
jgi:hypothetical protein